MVDITENLRKYFKETLYSGMSLRFQVAMKIQQVGRE